MSSSCSSIDLGIDPDFDDILTESLINDIELFVEHVNRLRNALDSKSYIPDGETKCVQIHAALSMVSQSVRDLLVKYPAFKTSQVLIPASQLVYSVKDINFDISKIDSSKSLTAIERLEAAIGTALRNSINCRSLDHQTSIYSRDTKNNSLTTNLEFGTQSHYPNKSQAQNHPASNRFLNSSTSTLASLGVKSSVQGGATSGVSGCSSNAGSYFSSNNSKNSFSPYSSSPLANFYLPSTNQSNNRTVHQLLNNSSEEMPNNDNCTDISQATTKLKIQSTMPMPTKMPHPKLVRRHSNVQPSKINNLTANSTTEVVNNGRQDPGLPPGIHRQQSNQDGASASMMRELLGLHENGIEMAFERCKAWSKYASHLLTFVRNRLALENEHSRNMQKLAEQTKSLLNADSNNTLENRQKEHDMKRRKLKSDWTKQKKQLDTCVDELRRARHILNSKEGGYLKARDLTLRHELSVPQANGHNNGGGGGGGGAVSAILGTTNDPQKKRKELEKKRKNEEDALNRKTDAENEVWRLERELESRRIALNELRLQIVGDLCDLIRHCDLTTTACASHFFKAFAELWAPIPEEYDRLATYAIRENSPGSEYMSFLQNQQNLTAGCASSAFSRAEDGNFLETMGARRNSPPSAGLVYPHSSSHHPLISSSAQSGGSCSLSMDSSSGAPRRRNALNADEHYDLIAETTQRRQKKSMTRLFEQSSSSACDASDAAKSHKLSKTRQVTKCAQCEHLVIFDALKCTICGIVWHKKCLTQVSVFCGPSARRLTAETAAHRRMSIFGVPLKGHLEAQQRKIPLILEKCVDELQKRGMSCKGLYRTCGVKSKIEQLCVMFEQTANEVDLSQVHPMNIASLIKLYLRRLPEPLLTYEMYRDWLDFDPDIGTTAVIKGLRDLVSRLPQQNYDTLKFLILHLKRVTWFELENLMTASNLAAVIAPSLIWQRICSDGPQSAQLPTIPQFTSMSVAQQQSTCNAFINDAHQQSKIVEVMVQNAFEVFLVDRSTDWQEFFDLYPDVEEPKLVDAETEACIAKKSNLELCETDCLDDDIYDICDMDEGEVICSGSTPANTADCSTSFGSGTQSGTGNSSSAQHDESSNSSFATANNKNGQQVSANNFAANFRRENFDSIKPASGRSTTNTTTNSTNSSPCQRRIPTAKQRSFTTSILVSPLADRKFHAILPASADPDSRNAFDLFTQQRKMTEISRSYQRLDSDQNPDGTNNCCSSTDRNQKRNGGGPLEATKSAENAEKLADQQMELNEIESAKRTLCSGEVVVDIKKDQYCLPNNYPNSTSSKTSNSCRIPLSSASFNSTPNSSNYEKKSLNDASNQHEIIATAIPPPPPPPPPTNQIPQRRRRLERSAYVSQNTDRTSNNQESIYTNNNNLNESKDLPMTTSASSSSKQIPLCNVNTVGVVFSGNDVSYV